MNANIGTIDRIARLVIGIVLITLAATGVIGLWGFIGILPMATALFRVCPAYITFGISTCSTEKTQ